MMTTQSAEKPTVLVVDDTPDNLTLISGLLKDQYKIKVANSGQRALKIVESAPPPDLVLLDIMMPEMDGYEVLGRIKSNENASDVPVIFLTAKNETNDKVKGFEAGAVDYISKPFQAEEVIARIDTHLTIRRLHRELQQKHDELERELKTVGQVQRSLLPTQLPEMNGLNLATFYEPSLYAGGDYYDVVELPGDRLGILIADVSGHGTHAAVLMAMTYSIFHDYPDVADDPVRVLSYMNEKLCPVCKKMFVTALYVVYDPTNRTIQYFSAGHMPPLIFRPSIDDFLELKNASHIPLGLLSWDSHENGKSDLALGDIITLYTDGISERMNNENELFSDERLCTHIRENGQTNPQRIVDGIVKENDIFAAGRDADDDCTLIVGVVV
jgi:serine phosphatase RsbU (regulator of sigma subunit)